MAVCSYTYTAEDVKQMLAEKKARGTARMNIATEKAKLVRIRDHAQEIGDENEVERYVAVLVVVVASRTNLLFQYKPLHGQVMKHIDDKRAN